MLVLDNYQEAPLDSELHEVMREALEEIPERSRLIFISRSEPPAAFARALAHEVVAVLDWPQLRFTPAEAGALVRARAPVRLTPATLRVLYDRTEGWCAGLILLHDQLRNGRALPGPSESTPEVLFDYFAGEIFQRADAAIQDVLMRTAFLPKMSEAMAEALTGQPRVGEMLATLHRQNYFTNKQAGNPPTYEYHPLFREFLLARAAQSYSRETLTTIRRTAAGFLDEAGRIEAAATLLRDASDWEGLAQLIHRHGATLLGQGRGGTIEEWLGHLPAAIFEEQPWLRFWRGHGLAGVAARGVSARAGGRVRGVSPAGRYVRHVPGVGGPDLRLRERRRIPAAGALDQRSSTRSSRRTQPFRPRVSRRVSPPPCWSRWCAASRDTRRRPCGPDARSSWPVIIPTRRCARQPSSSRCITSG